MNFLLSKLDPMFLDFGNMPVFPTAEHKLTLWMLTYLILATVLLVFAGNHLRKILIERVLPKFPNIEIAAGHTFASIISWTIMSVGFLVLLDTAGIDITIVTVLAGAVGIGASMSLQNIAPHVLGGLVVMCERTIKVGDHIEIGHIIGRVTDISMRSTAIVTNDNIAVIIPNAELVTSKVINWSYKDKNVRLRVPLAISKQSNLETVKRLLVEAALSHPGVLSRPAPEVRLTGFSDDAMNLSLLIWTNDYAGDPERLQSDLNYKIVSVLEQAHLPMPLSEGSIVAAAAMMVK